VEVDIFVGRAVLMVLVGAIVKTSCEREQHYRDGPVD
jgi:hypothetical protein